MRSSLVNRGLLLLCSFVLLAAGLFFITPKEVMATPNKSTDGTCTACHGNAFDNHGNSQGNSSQKPAVPTVQYVPEPYKPVDREANNALFGGGLALGAVVIGGAIFMDKRKK